MIRDASYTRTVCLLWLAMSCGRSPQLADVPQEMQPAAPVWPPGYPLVGEPCEGDTPACGWSATFPRSPSLLRCKDGTWDEAARCEDACEANGQCSAGCAVTDSGAACLCAPGASSCRQKASCQNHASVVVPDGPDIYCVPACRQSGDSFFAEGCGATSPGADEECLCTTLGAACPPSQTAGFCVGPALTDSNAVLLVTEAIATCVDGTWVATSCADYCGDPLATCRGFHHDEKHACSCDLT